MRNLSYPYPVEALRHWYLTPIGGQSSELEPGEIGLNREALAKNTHLVPFEDRVLISKLEGGRSKPVFTRRFFRVVPLDEASPEALSKSQKGEAILPLEEGDAFSETFEVGEIVVLNSVLSQRYQWGLVSAIDRLIQNRSDLPSLEVRRWQER
jgi:hypothetical protein